MSELEWSVVEAASWRLASELVRRHPDEARLIRAHPGGGQYDLLWIRQNMEPGRPGVDIRLNRAGTIQVCGGTGTAPEVGWEPTAWAEYLSADSATFVAQLERAVGWSVPKSVPAATPTTLTYRVLAAVAATAFKSVHPVVIEQGFIDSSGYGGGPSPRLSEFLVSDEVLRVRPDDLFGEAGYRFWIPCRDGRSLFAIEQTSATAWLEGELPPVDVMRLYIESGRDPAVVAGKLLEMAKAS